MSTLENQSSIHRAKILDIKDRILSGFVEDGYCRMLVMIKDKGTPEKMRTGLMCAANWIHPLNVTRQSLAELSKWI